MKPAGCPTTREDECVTQIQGSDALLQPYRRRELVDMRKTHDVCKRDKKAVPKRPTLHDFMVMDAWRINMRGENTGPIYTSILTAVLLRWVIVFPFEHVCAFQVLCMEHASLLSLCRGTTVQRARLSQQNVEPTARVQSPALLFMSSVILGK